MGSAAAPRIKHSKPSDISNQRKNGWSFVIGIPGIVLVVSVIGRCKRIIVILRQCLLQRQRPVRRRALIGF